MNRNTALTFATVRLAGVSDTPRLDAELLMAHALGVPREAMLLGDYEVPAGFEALIERRAAHEPVAYITGRRAFWTIELEVTSDVLIPRPDSETLIEACLDFVEDERHRTEPARILDLGTGSGALLLAGLDQWPGATGVGIDASEAALMVARRNGERIAPGRAAFCLGDWGSALNDRFDLILCNPPYIEDAASLPPDVRDYEPQAALFAGSDGLDCYRRIVPDLPRLLAPRGMIAVEIGAIQADAVCALFEQAGLSPRVRHDLAGRPRAITHFALGSDNARA